MFWNLYARIYDAINELIPYRNMLNEAVARAKSLEGRKILDVGCGTGNLEKYIEDSKVRCSIVAVDASDAMLRRAQHKAPSVVFQKANLDRSLQEQGIKDKFDVIFGINVLYTLQSPPALIRELSALANPGAVMVQATPKAGAGLKKILEDHRQRHDGSGRFGQIRLTLALLLVGVFNVVILGRQQRGRYHFPSREELTAWYENSGWTIKEISTTYADQNWLVIAEKNR